MAKFVMVYESMTGNTEVMARAIAKGIREAGEEVIILEGYEADAALLGPYDGLLIGTYTWNAGDITDEMMDFYEGLVDTDLPGKKAVVFGSFDSMYGDGGAAIDTFISTLKKAGADVIADGYKN